MANYKDAFPSDWLKAHDFEDSPAKLTISEYGMTKIGGEQKPFIKFREHTKGLILNKTNGHLISQIAGSEDTDDWAGVVVVLYQTETQYGLDMVPCIRVRAPKATPKPKPVQDVEDDSGVPF